MLTKRRCWRMKVKCEKCGRLPTGRPLGTKLSPESKEKISKSLKAAWLRLEKEKKLVQPHQVTNTIEVK